MKNVFAIVIVLLIAACSGGDSNSSKKNLIFNSDPAAKYLGKWVNTKDPHHTIQISKAGERYRLIQQMDRRAPETVFASLKDGGLHINAMVNDIFIDDTTESFQWKSSHNGRLGTAPFKRWMPETPEADAQLAKWEYVAGSEKISAFIDPTTIIKDGRTRKVWVLYDFGIEPRVNKDNGQKAYSRKNLTVYSCQEKKSAHKISEFFAANLGGGKLLERQESENLKWGALPKNSMGEAVLERVCRS